MFTRYCPRPLEGRGHVTLARGDSNTLRCAQHTLRVCLRRCTRVFREKAAKNASSFEPICTVTFTPFLPRAPASPHALFHPAFS